MTRGLYLAIAGVVYAVFFATFLYLIAFVGDLRFAPVTVDRGSAGSGAILWPVAVVADLGLVALVGVQHSVMARNGFKAAWTRFVPPALERSVYVLASSLVLIILYALWCPVPIVVWTTAGVLGGVLWALFAAGWAIVLLSTYLLNHSELFGLAQVYRHWRGTSVADPRFRTPLFYRLVRHPLYSGFLIAFWAAPTMTVGRVVLAAGLTLYVVVAIRFEERDLVAQFGEDYVAFRATTGTLVPGVGRR